MVSFVRACTPLSGPSWIVRSIAVRFACGIVRHARLEVYPLRYRDRLTGKWVRARCVAELHEFTARYNEWETPGRRSSASFVETRAISDRGR